MFSTFAITLFIVIIYFFIFGLLLSSLVLLNFFLLDMTNFVVVVKFGYLCSSLFMLAVFCFVSVITSSPANTLVLVFLVRHGEPIGLVVSGVRRET